MRNLVIILIIFSFYACQSGVKKIENTNFHEVKIVEVLQATEYTYLFVSENNNKKWLAVSKMYPEVGDTYYYEGGWLMNNFESKDLEKTFESILFIDKISDEPITEKENESELSPQKPKIKKKTINIKQVEGGISIAELYANKSSYNDKTIKINGVVTKFNAEIMGKNWIHLQDGSENKGKFDLTVTSNVNVKEGDTICVEGKISIDKDFGYGYFYEIIMEEAKICTK